MTALWPPQGCYGAWLFATGWQLPVMAADAAFFLAYTVISVRLLTLKTKAARAGMSPWVLNGFAAFIFLCGSYHAVAALRVVWLLYDLSVAVTILGALVSLAVAVFFWPFVSRLEAAIDAYVSGGDSTAEIARRASLLVAREELLRDSLRDIKALHAAATGGRDVF